ncbi:2-succinyl-5-enolpyruvyl-6-hydroxy-3-cyclohexene-1-carboxylic-acid synthase [Lacisediminihabitans profunda]|uniref:2-succinyl-5-enolpyruvyl-6-hydroxy-3-cyclohexene-1-carboxylate synthase n=1 Tax=Lacisediminihabitans profunda TaxID=2594790 RepID=A0A5C8UXW1_9MICO|nr:2-succinyl-5-enolpyruvyl-6-hydroxy-3-cyclohexene-1-carboxylic-acid synthase [Lacisediminihabitans profunda]
MPERPGANPATEFAVAILGELIRRGVRDVVLCPGSRSQALALAAAAFEQAGLIRLRVRIDERVAGFLALGLAVETRTPVLVITTSGTAVANLHPAVLEAHHSGVPLILFTADRPLELRGIGSNQTTEQVGIFGPAVTWVRDVEAPSHTGFDPDYPGEVAHEAYSAAAGHSSTPGPVQLNLAFREPLSGPVARLPQLDEHQWPERTLRRGLEVEHAPNTVVIAGHGAGPQAEALARSIGVPLIAEVSSGSRFGPNLVGSYRDLLSDPEFGGRVERAIVFGHPTLSREVPALLERDGVTVQVIRAPGAEPYNPGRRASSVHDFATHEGGPDESLGARRWLGTWVQAGRERLPERAAQPEPAAAEERAGDFAREQLAAFREPITRRLLVETVWRLTWPHDRLVLGASRLIRVADAEVQGKKISVHANRGLAGIDGTVSTGLGIALASQEPGLDSGGASRGTLGLTRVLLGDLAVLHDAGALLFGLGEVRPRIQVVVGNDGGGTIFDGLEVASTAPRDALDRVLYTPQSVDLRALAAAYGWEYRTATSRGELDVALAASDSPTIVEVPLVR